MLAQHPLEGKGRAEVVERLGPPTSTDKWDESEMIYLLGPQSGLFGIDHEWLLIELDAVGRVASYQIVSD